MTNQSVELPVQSYHPLIYLLCPDCGQLHYFYRREPLKDGSHVLYNHPQAPNPTEFVTGCPSCLAMQENDPTAVRAAFDRTVGDPHHAEEMRLVMVFTAAELPNRVLACSRCHNTVLFSTDWKGNVTSFWAWGMERLTNMAIDDEKEYKNLMAGDPDCGFCERLHESEPDAIAEADAYTEKNFPDLNDDPPLL